MVDSLMLAKQRYPGMPNSLDALCRRLGVDNSMRHSHNALLDVQLLAQVYLELMGGRQPGFVLALNRAAPAVALDGLARPRTAAADRAERGRAGARMRPSSAKLKEPLWLQYRPSRRQPKATPGRCRHGQVQGKVALVTGAASGIGAACAAHPGARGRAGCC